MQKIIECPYSFHVKSTMIPIGMAKCLINAKQNLINAKQNLFNLLFKHPIAASLKIFVIFPMGIVAM